MRLEVGQPSRGSGRGARGSRPGAAPRARRCTRQGSWTGKVRRRVRPVENVAPWLPVVALVVLVACGGGWRKAAWWLVGLGVLVFVVRARGRLRRRRARARLRGRAVRRVPAVLHRPLPRDRPRRGRGAAGRHRRHRAGGACHLAEKCGRRDSNPQGLRHRHLKPARLPVPPRPRAASAIAASRRREIVGSRRHGRERATIVPRSPEPPQGVVEGDEGDRASCCCSPRAVLMIVIRSAAGTRCEGAKPLQIAYIVIYLVMAFLVMRWNRGVLPVAAALAIVLLIFAAVSGPAWFDRDKAGFDRPGARRGHPRPAHPLLLVPVQILLIAFAMRGFQQAWNVEVERSPDERRGDDRAATGCAPARRLLSPAPPGWWNWQTRWLSKAIARKGVRVRIPPRALLTGRDRAGARKRWSVRRMLRACSKSSPSSPPSACSAWSCSASPATSRRRPSSCGRSPARSWAAPSS